MGSLAVVLCRAILGAAWSRQNGGECRDGEKEGPLQAPYLDLASEGWGAEQRVEKGAPEPEWVHVRLHSACSRQTN